MSKTPVIPDFEDFKNDIIEIFEQVAPHTEGTPDEDLFPEGLENPPFAVSICTIDGQLLQLGDHHLSFSVQSISKPINYGIALEERGEELVHQHIGREPGAENFEKGMVLNRENLPHNPMINSGSIMSGCLIKPDWDNKKKLKHVTEIWEQLCGGISLEFDHDAFQKEMKASHSNFAMAHIMMENGAFPENTDLQKAVEFHYLCCSIGVNIDDLAHAAATLANYGLSPTTGSQVFSHKTVRDMLSLMLSCGMYDHSGQYAFKVGIPSKSGVAGGLIAVIPELMGISIYSPPLDKHGNTVRGVKFCEKLVEKFNFHKHDALFSNIHGKKDPRIDYRKR
ncbi:glutaminase [Litoribacter ruber]|uniref:glutaminase n=1 Tax=Litoribacter ruber TaxID=702568 RepID=UPI001BD9F304|nr:glutaminase [Litoribacter ruber]MBT0810077.1 glutaminase [Litoribacter ruber]